MWIQVIFPPILFRQTTTIYLFPQYIAFFTSYGQDDSVFLPYNQLPAKGIFSSACFLSRVPRFLALALTSGINYQNAGTDTVGNGYVQLVKDSRLDFVSSPHHPDDFYPWRYVIRWNYSNLFAAGLPIHACGLTCAGKCFDRWYAGSIATINPIETDVLRPMTARLSYNRWEALSTRMINQRNACWYRCAE